MAEVIFVEGVDATGKGTQIENIKQFYEKKGFPVHIIHYSNIKGLSNNKEVEKYSRALYKDMFELAAETNGDRVLIFDRAHLGEFVYSPMYRSYDGSYVFDFEKELAGCDWAKCSLFVFTDSVKEIIKRDKARGDGLSFTLDPEKKALEVDAFNQAYELSSLRKHKVEIKGRSPEEIFEQEIKPYLSGAKRMSSDGTEETVPEETNEEEKPKKTTTKKTQTTKKKVEAKK